MSKSERAFQAYFMQIAKPMNYHRIALLSGSGFPDVEGFHGARYSLVELKDLILGKRGDRKLRGLFEASQPPWYIQFFKAGGSRLFIAFRIRDFDESNRRYGLWKPTWDEVMQLGELSYSYLKSAASEYQEFPHCKTMIETIEHFGDQLKWKSQY